MLINYKEKCSENVLLDFDLLKIYHLLEKIDLVHAFFKQINKTIKVEFGN